MEKEIASIYPGKIPADFEENGLDTLLTLNM